MTGIACPSMALCVAVDDAGNVVSSTNPTGGASEWHVVNVEGTTAFAAVSCPSASLCVGAGGRDLLVSSSPAGDATGWTIDHNADTGVGPECGKYGGDSGCYSPLKLLSCPTVTFCEGIDGYAAEVTGNPSTQTWRSDSGDGQEIEGLACLRDSSCLTLCAVGAGLGGFDCLPNGQNYDASSLCSRSCFELSPGEPTGLWCTSESACFAGDGSGNLSASTNPTGGTSTWIKVVTGQLDNNTGGATVTGVSCPSASSCVAVTAAGKLLLGPPPPTTSQARTLLLQGLIPPARSRALRTLRKRARYVMRFYAPEPGYLKITWSVLIKQPGIKRRHVVLARGENDVPAIGFYRVRLLLRKRASEALPQHGRTQIIATATVTHGAGPTIRATKRFAAAS